MDSFEFNKIAGAVLASLLVLLGVGMFLVPVLYAPVEPEKQAYIVQGVEVEGGHSDGAAAEAAPEKPFEALIAEATADRGERVARRCVACHSFNQGGDNKVGPNLWGVMGGKKAHLDSFAYSDAMKSKGGVWDWESLNAFLTKPTDYVPGTIMSFAGLSKPEDRAAVMTYLAAQAATPYAKPAVPEMAAPEAPDAAAVEEAAPEEAMDAMGEAAGEHAAPERDGQAGGPAH